MNLMEKEKSVMKKMFIIVFSFMFMFGVVGNVMADSNGVKSSVNGGSYHEIVNEYGNKDVGGWGHSYGFGSYQGKVKDNGNTAAENWICGSSDTLGRFDFSNNYYEPGKPDCCFEGLGPFEDFSKVYSHTKSRADLWGDGTLKNGKLKAEGKVGIGSWSNSVENKKNWANAGQSVTATYKVVDKNPDLGDGVNGWAGVDGGTASYATLDNTGNHRSSEVGSVAGNEAQVRAFGGKKHFTMNGSGGVAGNTFIGHNNLNKFGGVAGGYYEASFSYKLNDHRGYAGWNGDGGAKGYTGANIDKWNNGMEASSFSKSGAHSCPSIR